MTKSASKGSSSRWAIRDRRTTVTLGLTLSLADSLRGRLPLEASEEAEEAEAGKLGSRFLSRLAVARVRTRSGARRPATSEVAAGFVEVNLRPAWRWEVVSDLSSREQPENPVDGILADGGGEKGSGEAAGTA